MTVGARRAGDDLPQRFLAQVRRRPDTVAVAGREEVLTYSGLGERSGRLARLLRASGVRPEVPVAVCLEPVPAIAVALMGVLRSGGAYLPLDPAYPRDRLRSMLEDSSSPLVVTSDPPPSNLPRDGLRTVRLAAGGELREEARGEVTAEADCDGEPLAESLAYVVYTSGSMGRPKGVAVSRGAAGRHLWVAGQVMGHRPGDRVLQFAGLAFDVSLEELVTPLLRGATVLLLGRELWSPARFFSQAARWRVTVVDLPAAYWHLLAQEGDWQAGWAPLRLVSAGGEALHPGPARRWVERTRGRLRLLNSYGPTETVITATRYELPRDPGEIDGEGCVSIGWPQPGRTARVLDRRGDPVPEGAAGELWLGGAGLARGYLGRPADTVDRFRPDPVSRQRGSRLYRTGDLARRRPDGGLEFLGRVDRQVKVRGYRIEPGEVEAVLGSHPAVLEAAVVPRGEGEGVRLVAYVALRQVLEEEEIRRYLGERLPAFMVPESFVPLPRLPRSPAGKLDRRSLPPPPREAGSPASRPPRSDEERVLAAIAAELLGREQVGVEDDLLALGAHSLLLARLAARGGRALGVDLPLAPFFERPTVAALAGAAAAGTAVPRPRRQAREGDRFPLSFAQERVWFLDRLAPGNLAYSTQTSIRWLGPLRVGVLERAFTEIVRRHQVLRTTFHAGDDGRPVQVVRPPFAVRVPTVDLGRLGPGAGEAEAERRVARALEVPFDLGRLPLVRWTLFRLTAEDQLMLQMEHHFVHDGWSLALLLRELKDLYEAFAAGRPSPLPEPEIQYADFVLWQRRWLRGDVLERQLDYWRHRLDGCPMLLDLPSDRPRPRAPSFAGNALEVALPAELSTALRRRGRRAGVTLFVTMLAAFAALLHRYAGKRDLAVGSGFANRRLPESESMIGMVVNTLVLRLDLTGDPSPDRLLDRTRRTVLEAHAHQDLPFEKLVEELKPERHPGANPIFQVLFSFHDSPVPDLDFAGLRGLLRDLPNRSAKTDLNVVGIPRSEQRLGQGPLAPAAGAEVRFVWEYSTDLFDRTTMLRMWRHYRLLLEAVAGGEERALFRVPLLTAEERQQLQVETAPRPAVAAPLLPARFRTWAARRPDAIAAVCGEERLSYGELARRARWLAAELRRRGAGPEVVVGLLAERSLAQLAGVLGVQESGAAYLPLDPSYPRERLAFSLDDAEAALLLAGEVPVDCLPDGWRAGDRVVSLALGPGRLDAPDLAPPVLAPESLAYVLYTSGSTGKPKGTAVTHGNAGRLFEVTRARFDFGPDDVWTLFHSPAFDFSVWETWGALGEGGRLVVVPQEVARAPRTFWRLLVKERVTVLNQTPSAFRQLARAAAEAGDGPGATALRRVIFGGEALEPAALSRWLEPGGPELVNMYGITETTVHVTRRRLRPADAATPSRSPIGVPLPDLGIVLLDRRGRPVPPGVPGEIHVAGAGLARGYLRRPGLTAQRFLPDASGTSAGARLYRAGDLARRLADGELEFLGRIDEQVKLRGFRVELGEIETVLAEHPAVAAAAAAPWGEGDGRRLAAYFVPAGNPPALEELRRWLADRLPAHMLPAAILPLDELPRTPSGKLDRRALPTPGERRSPGGAHSPPTNDVERAVAAAWRRVLGLDRVGVDESFFDLGGHSLLLLEVQRRLEESFGRTLPVVELFAHPTVRDQARWLEGELAGRSRPEAGGALAAVRERGRGRGGATAAGAVSRGRARRRGGAPA